MQNKWTFDGNNVYNKHSVDQLVNKRRLFQSGYRNSPYYIKISTSAGGVGTLIAHRTISAIALISIDTRAPYFTVVPITNNNPILDISVKDSTKAILKIAGDTYLFIDSLQDVRLGASGQDIAITITNSSEQEFNS